MLVFVLFIACVLLYGTSRIFTHNPRRLAVARAPKARMTGPGRRQYKA